MIKEIFLNYITKKMHFDKEEATKVFDTFIAEFGKADKTNDERHFKIEFQPSTNPHPNGIGFNVKTADEKLFKEILPEEVPTLKDAPVIGTISLKVKDPSKAKLAEDTFNQYLPMLQPMLPPHLEIAFRAKECSINIDVIIKDVEDLKLLNELGVSLTDYNSFKVKARNDLKIDEYFALEPIDIVKKTSEFQIIFNAQFFKINALLNCLIKSVTSIDLSAKLKELEQKANINPEDSDDENWEASDEKFQVRRKLRHQLKAVGSALMFRAFQNFDMKLTYDPKTPTDLMQCEATLAESLKKVNKKVKKYRKKVEEGIEMVKPMIEGFGVSEILQSLDLDKIVIAVLLPKYKNGVSLKFNLPGLTKALAEKVFA
ncbi:MAG: hypothetical protein MJ252_31145 [archaeon]|nr:hypothetical protein [archaeon]